MPLNQHFLYSSRVLITLKDHSAMFWSINNAFHLLWLVSFCHWQTLMAIREFNLPCLNCSRTVSSQQNQKKHCFWSYGCCQKWFVLKLTDFSFGHCSHCRLWGPHWCPSNRWPRSPIPKCLCLPPGPTLM